jgi:hypothetical protein
VSTSSQNTWKEDQDKNENPNREKRKKNIKK